MPLTATVADRRLEAWTLSPAEWAELKRGYRKLGCTMSCGELGHPKTSRLGTQYFAHMPNIDCQLHEGGPEGPEHLRAKAILAEAARGAGWTATVEFPAPDRSWIADVLIERGTTRMALEVQWSPQSTDDFIRRQERYAKAGVHGRWFVSERNRAHASTVPSFVIAGSAEELLLELPDEVIRHDPGKVPLSAGLELLLAGSFKRHVEVNPVAVLVEVAMAKCWVETCAKWLTLWRLRGVEVTTRCGESILYSNWLGYEEHRAERTETAIQAHVKPAIDASDLPAAVRYDTRHDRVAGYHKAMICPHCNIVFGDRYVNEWTRRWSSYRLPMSRRIALPAPLLEVAHVCVDKGHGRCAPADSKRSDVLIERSWVAQALDGEVRDPLPERGARRRVNQT